MAPTNQRKHVSFSTYADDSDLDIQVVYFHPEEILSPSTSSSSSNSSVELPSPPFRLSRELPAGGFTTRGLRPWGVPYRPSTLHMSQLQLPRSEATSNPVRLVDVTLDSPIELPTPLPKSHARPEPLYVRREQSRHARPRLGTSIHPYKLEHRVGRRPLDLVEPPPVRFTQILASSPMFRHSTNSPVSASHLANDTSEGCFDSLVTLTRFRRAFSESTATILRATRHLLEKEAGRKQATWQMFDEEAQIISTADRAHRARSQSYLQGTDKRVVDQGGVAFARLEVIDEEGVDVGGWTAHAHKHYGRGEIAEPKQIVKGFGIGDTTNWEFKRPVHVRRVQKERRKARRMRKWVKRRIAALEGCRDMVARVFAWPAGYLSWAGEDRGVSWCLLLAIVAVTVMGMVLAFGRLAQA